MTAESGPSAAASPQQGLQRRDATALQILAVAFVGAVFLLYVLFLAGRDAFEHCLEVEAEEGFGPVSGSVSLLPPGWKCRLSNARGEKREVIVPFEW